MVPQATSAIVASPLGGRFSAKFNPYSAMFIGLSVGALGFSSLIVINENTLYVLVALLTFCAGFGMAFAMPAATLAAINAVSYEFAGNYKYCTSNRKRVWGRHTRHHDSQREFSGWLPSCGSRSGRCVCISRSTCDAGKIPIPLVPCFPND